MNKFDVYIITSWKDWDVAKANVPFIMKNIPAEKVYIVTSDKIKTEIEKIPGCFFLDENKVFDGLSFTSVKDYLAENDYITENTGWYLQQFIKLSLGLIVENDYYLVWDADTMPMRRLEFFDENNRPYFNLKREHFGEYFRTINNLFGIEKITKESFISEHMMFSKTIVTEMLNKIENNKKLKGDNFWQKIISASVLKEPGFLKDDQRFFSEFETYGTYIDHFYPDMYAKRRLVTLRNGAGFFGCDLSSDIYDWIAEDFDTVSFEKWAVPMEEFIPLTKNPKYRSKTSALKYIKRMFKIQRRRAYISMLKRDFDAVDAYSEFHGAVMMDFIFDKKPWYGYKQRLSKRAMKKMKAKVSKMLGYGI